MWWGRNTQFGPKTGRFFFGERRRLVVVAVAVALAVAVAVTVAIAMLLFTPRLKRTRFARKFFLFEQNKRQSSISKGF